MTEQSESPQAKAERQRRRRVELFDSMADLALNNVISMDEAVRRYKLLVINAERPLEDFMPKRPGEGGDA